MSSFVSGRCGSQSLFLWLREANRKRVFSCFPRHGKRNPEGVESQRDGPVSFPDASREERSCPRPTRSFLSNHVGEEGSKEDPVSHRIEVKHRAPYKRRLIHAKWTEWGLPSPIPRISRRGGVLLVVDILFSSDSSKSEGKESHENREPQSRRDRVQYSISFPGQIRPSSPRRVACQPVFPDRPALRVPASRGEKNPPCGVRDEGGDSIEIILPPSMGRSSISPLQSRRGAGRFTGPTSDPLSKLITISLIGERSSGSRSPVGLL